MKADLAIYSLVVGMSGLWVNVATMLNNKLDFYCCDNSVGFCKSGHIYCYRIGTAIFQYHNHCQAFIVVYELFASMYLSCNTLFMFQC